MAKVVVIGGGIAGISAAVGARKAGAEVILLERQDQLLGIGRIAGSMDVGGRYPLHLEIVEMGAGEVNEVLDSISLPNMENYRKSHYPWHSLPGSEEMTKHSWIYNVLTAEPALRRLLEDMGVEIRWRSRAVDVAKEGNHVTKVKLASGEWIEGDAFIDTCGSAGGMDQCVPNVGGCVMCPWMQCPTFGNRVNISGKAGATTVSMRQKDGRPGVKYNGIYLYKGTLSKELQDQLAECHQIFVPFRGVIDWETDPEWSWATRGQDGNDGMGRPADPETSWRVSPDTGRFRLLDRGIFAGGAGPSPIPLEKLRQIPGFENVVVAAPVGGQNLWSLGHDLVLCENNLRVPPLDNLFTAGSKAHIVDIQPGINTGYLAGFNAVRVAVGKEPVELPQTTVTGDIIAFTQQFLRDSLNSEYGGPTTFVSAHAGPYLRRLKDIGFFPDNPEKAKKRIAEAGLTDFFKQTVV
ncbi:MAG: FAD-dependent oxidoreductase [Anaerolineae bacterium]|nr:FAD-dependent oxidoreductase [Anaerolineae bacterium]